ncbi:hypothetical protein HJC23_000686 [Cyclotella cryptica]|uniref:Uncharacterized protein n=1 Tax=Cyclotella cryptica TaxID=29204 RepID=A0ABD3Q9Y8_9STRA|eukprot:CCRYP_007363-RA/>CCRYP_007363-RA protein AED:0.18 eAED:0.18 QI:352/1/1/1/1/1/2/2795/163
MIFEADESMEILKQGEDSNQKAIDSYSNYDLKDICSVLSSSSSSTGAKSSKSNDEDSLTTSEEDDNNAHFTGLDATESHGTFITHDDEYLKMKIPKKIAVGAVFVTGSRETEEEDGCIRKEFTGQEGATSEVYEEFKESLFDTEEVQFDEEYNDYTFETSNFY